jgi:AcrR family transcriptional regulator
MRDNTVGRKPGRPRGFDEAEIVRVAQAAFVRLGFEAAPYEEIGASIGLSKPSLYNSFGDKSALFHRAMTEYAAAASAQIVETYKKANSLQKGVAAVLREAATVYTPDPAISVGCLLVGTALPATVNDPEARRIYAGFIETLERDLTAATRERFAADAVAMGKSPGQVALLIGSLIFSLAVRARAGVSRVELRRIAKNLAALVV